MIRITSNEEIDDDRRKQGDIFEALISFFRNRNFLSYQSIKKVHIIKGGDLENVLRKNQIYNNSGVTFWQGVT